MPKMKTHKGASKRLKRTGTGKIRHRQAYRGHYRLAKGRKRYRRGMGSDDASPGDAKRMKRLLRS